MVQNSNYGLHTAAVHKLEDKMDTALFEKSAKALEQELRIDLLECLEFVVQLVPFFFVVNIYDFNGKRHTRLDVRRLLDDASISESELFLVSDILARNVIDSLPCGIVGKPLIINAHLHSLGVDIDSVFISSNQKQNQNRIRARCPHATYISQE